MKIFRTKTFVKDCKKTIFTDGQYLKYIDFLHLLLEKKELPAESRDHSLQGEWNDFREFHIGGDLLVIYRIQEDILQLVRIGTHAQLFKKF